MHVCVSVSFNDLKIKKHNRLFLLKIRYKKVAFLEEIKIAIEKVKYLLPFLNQIK